MTYFDRSLRVVQNLIESFHSSMFRRCHANSLAVFRIAFGFAMVVDTLYERGMINAELVWKEDECRFPVFHFIRPLPLDWMYFIYFIMLVGATNMCLGFLFKFSTRLYCICYWFVILQNKLKLNNHSYLFGLTSILLSTTNAHNVLSLDSWLEKSKADEFVPWWQYFILKSQVFLVYFIAGLKKLDADWRHGFSMKPLADKWVFSPFNWIWGKKNTSTFIHQSGLWIDLLIGFVLAHPVIKPLGLFFSTMFHGMNACAFSIGVFPYVMLATNILFLDARLTNYFKKEPKSIKSKKPFEKKKNTTCCVVAYLAFQSFLPFSHFLFPGYSNWTEGFYGYSWDMMVHRWYFHHIRMEYSNRHNIHDRGYLKPEFFSKNEKWILNPSSIHQMATCVQESLSERNLKNISLYFDLWMSLNGRVVQRATNPQVDVLSSPWSPFTKPSFTLPILKEFDEWRPFLGELKEEVNKKDNRSIQLYIADFPGMSMENVVPEKDGNVTVLVLRGSISVETHQIRIRNQSLMSGDFLEVPSGSWYKITTTSSSPSCMLFLQATNKSKMSFESKLKYENRKKRTLLTALWKCLEAVGRIMVKNLN